MVTESHENVFFFFGGGGGGVFFPKKIKIVSREPNRISLKALHDTRRRGSG